MKGVFAVLAAMVLVSAGARDGVAQGPASPTTQKATDKKSTGAKKDDTPVTVRTAIGTVKSVVGDSIVVAGRAKGADTEWTFAVDSTTRVRKGGKETTATQLRPGDPVRVRYVEQDGKTVAQNVFVTTSPKPKADTPASEKK